MNPVVSIILTAYNASASISKCLSSAINQTMGNIEIIVIDDNSTDDTLTILHNMKQKDERITIISHKTNEGPHCSRYDGVMAAQGKYLIFLDDDDDIVEDLCEIAINAIEQYDVDVLQFRSSIIFENLDPERFSHIYTITQPNPFIIQYPIKSVFGGVKWNANLVVWNKLYKTNVVKKAYEVIGRPCLYYDEDLLENFVVYLSSASTHSIPNALYNYHYGAGMYPMIQTDIKRIEKKIGDALFIYRFVSHTIANNSNLNGEKKFLDDYCLIRIDNCFESIEKIEGQQEISLKTICNMWKGTEFVGYIRYKQLQHNVKWYQVDRWMLIALIKIFYCIKREGIRKTISICCTKLLSNI